MGKDTPNRPTALKVDITKVPLALQHFDQWVVWNYLWNGERWRKPPIAPTGYPCDWRNPENWLAFEQATERYHEEGADGIGFVFTSEDDFCGVDLDKVRDPETGELTPRAEEIVREFASYTEISPSGTGVKIFGLGQLLNPGVHKNWIEVYDCLRFFAVTGHRLEGVPDQVNECQEALERLLASLGVERKLPTRANDDEEQGIEQWWSGLSDKEVLEKMRLARNSVDLMRLWSGGWEPYYGWDHSLADFWLVRHLAFYCGPCIAQIDHLFRQSCLMRPKWDHEQDGFRYGRHTVVKVLGRMENFYHWRGQHPVTSYQPDHCLDQNRQVI
jgi:primase-polymerase (primpol)-like protein